MGASRKGLLCLSMLVIFCALVVASPAISSAEERVVIQADEVALSELVVSFSELCGQNFVLKAQELAGEKVSIYAPGPLTRQEACELFVTAVQMRGLVVQQEDSYWTLEAYR